jgi:hypothetical protein
MFKKVYLKFHDETISLSLDGTMMSVEKLPFPAITFFADAVSHEHTRMLLKAYRQLGKLRIFHQYVY